MIKYIKNLINKKTEKEDRRRNPDRYQSSGRKKIPGRVGQSTVWTEDLSALLKIIDKNLDDLYKIQTNKDLQSDEQTLKCLSKDYGDRIKKQVEDFVRRIK